MKNRFCFLSLCALLCTAFFAACDETEEVSAYDNWQARNEAFIDSIRTEAGDNYLTWLNPDTRATVDLQTQQMEPGELYALLVQDGGNTDGRQYVYCKKLVNNPDGERVLYTDNVNVFMHSTYINGVKLIYNFEGYGALDQEIPLDAEDMLQPTPFDEPATVSVSSDSRVPGGLRWVLQYARTGERWVVYIPYYDNVGYGDNTSTLTNFDGKSVRIMEYSALAYDVMINEIVTE